MITRRSIALALTVVWIAPALAAAEEAATKVVDDVTYSSARAKELWRPMEGSPDVSVVTVEGRRAVKMHCNFALGRIERASWDRKVTLDLTRGKGVRMAFWCADASPVSSFTVYLRSGKGWYRGNFAAPMGKGWGEVDIPKSEMGIEGEPSGWGRIDTIRISAWRGGKVDTAFCIAGIGVYGVVDGGVVIVRGDQAVRQSPGEAESVKRYAAIVAGMFDDTGLPNVVMSDSDLTAERLAKVKLIVLPYNPVMDARTVGVIKAYLKSGGKMLSCYHLPGGLAEAAGIKRGGHVRQKQAGRFASIRPVAGMIAGAPAVTTQASWNIGEARPIAGRSGVAAWWHDAAGRSTGQAAVVASDNTVHVTHVILGDDRTNKQRLVLALAGRASSDLWRLIAAGRLARAGVFGPYKSFASADAAISKLAQSNAPARAALLLGRFLRDDARALMKAGKHVEASAKAAAAGQALVEAYLLAQKPVAGEHRAFWCHNAFGVDGLTWDQAVKRLADNGFTAVIPNMLWGQTAYYKSTVLPVAPEVADKGDQIALCLAACKKYNVECHVWKVNYNMGWTAPAKTAAALTAQGRTQVGFDGKANEKWLCPSHPDNQALEIASMVEIARKYDVHGLHFDYIRYPNRDHCFCTPCRLRFEKAAGVKVTRWPADVRDKPELASKWLAFRREQITTVVAAVSKQARAARPGIKISAAVFSNWPVDRDRIGQDWKLWCERGYLDFVCPMDYTPHSSQFERLVTNQLQWAGKAKCYPGIGLSVWSNPTDACSLIEKIAITRRLKTGGFTVFNYGPAQARDVLPALGKGTTRK